MSHCRCCGKPLSDPVSLAAGIGPVCSIKLKQAEAGNGDQSDLFGKAQFTYHVVGDVVVILDACGGGKTVTNDVYAVLDSVALEIGSLRDRRVIYRDADGIFDGISLNEAGGFRGFYSIRADNEEAALGKLG